MGNFYTNATIKNIDRADIISLLKKNGRECYVSPEVDGFTTIYDLECEEQNPQVLKRLAVLVSANLDCDVITFVNHDEDILAFKIYESGNLVADYEAKPDYFETGLELDLTPEQNAKSIVEIFGVKKDSLQSVKALLEKEFAMAIELHENLISALGIPSLSVGYGYNYLSRGEYPSGLTIDDFEHIIGDRTFFPQ